MNHKVYLAISAILTVLVTVAMLLLWGDRNSVFWTIYVFLNIAIWSVGVNAACMPTENKSFASNMTAVTVSIVYLIANVGWSIISAALLAADATLCLVGHVILLGIFLILWLLAKMAAKYINSQDN